jgi:hypothetical protein
MAVLGFVFIISTTLILLFIIEKKETYSDEEASILSTYKSLWKILKLKSIQKLLIFLLTWRVSL